MPMKENETKEIRTTSKENDTTRKSPSKSWRWTVSAGFTDPEDRDTSMQLNTVYRLAAGVQVRNEVFGLLFYDYRGPRLYFVPSRNLMTDTFFEGRQSVGDLLDQLADEMPWPRGRLEQQLGQVLSTLEGKGLIHGESIC